MRELDLWWSTSYTGNPALHAAEVLLPHTASRWMSDVRSSFSSRLYLRICQPSLAVYLGAHRWCLRVCLIAQGVSCGNHRAYGLRTSLGFALQPSPRRTIRRLHWHCSSRHIGRVFVFYKSDVCRQGNILAGECRPSYRLLRKILNTDHTSQFDKSYFLQSR